MKILRSIKRFLSWRGRPGPTDDYWYNIISPKSKAGPEVDQNTALNLSAVWAAVNFLAGTIASLPLHLYQHTENGKQKATSNPLYRVLHSQANPMMIAYNGREAIMVHLLLWGNSYSEIIRDGAGRVIAYWPITPNRVKPQLDDKGSLIYEITVPGGKSIILPRSKVLHVPGLGFNGLVGKSVIEVARESLGLNLAMEEYGARFFSNDARPGGVLEHPGSLDDEAFDRLNKSWASAHQGLKQSHRIAILEEGMKFHETSFTPEDSQFLQSRQYSVTEIARWFNLPPHVLKDLTRATFSNIESQAIELVVYSIRPWLVRLEQSFNSFLITRENQGRLFAEHSIQGLLRGDAAARSEYYGKLFNIGALSINDIRELENMNAVEGGDQRFVPLNMIPLNQAGQLPDVGKSSNEEKSLLLTEVRSDKDIVKGRNRIQARYRRIFESIARKIVSKEVKAVRQAVKKYLGKRSAKDFIRWLDKYYETFGVEATREILPVLMAYADVIGPAAASEIGSEFEMNDDLEKFVREYAEVFGVRHISSSKGQLQALVRDVSPDEIQEAIEERLNEWEEKRPGKIVARETVQANNAIARTVFIGLGVVKFRWLAQGRLSCPYCQELDGKVVGVDTPFIGEGDFKPKGADGSMRVRGPKFNPPLHEGCVCSVVASI